MTFSHYDDDTLTDVRHALIEAYDCATLARFFDEGSYNNIQLMLEKLEDVANDLGFDLVKRTKPIVSGVQSLGEYPEKHQVCDKAAATSRLSPKGTSENAGVMARLTHPVSLPCDSEPPEAA